MDTIWIRFSDEDTPATPEAGDVQGALLTDLELVVEGSTVRVVSDPHAPDEVEHRRRWSARSHT